MRLDEVRDDVVPKLQALVRIPTVSDRDPALVDTAAFDRLLETLREQFPLVHERLELTRVSTHGLLLHWPGASDGRPVVLMAHLDVVPVDEGAPWQHPPFDAVVVDGAVWGRGTLDDKGCVVAICEAVERLLQQGFSPAQDVWLSFGCNEEVGGDSAPLAVIGVTEKGTTSLRLVAEGRGGHASVPAPMGPTARIARAVTRLEKAPFPPRTPAPTIELLRRVAPHAPRPLRPVLSRAASLGPALSRLLVAAGPEAAAMTRTTAAVTTLSGSPALNVIASRAPAGVNLRVMVGDTVASAIAHVRKAIRDDTVTVEVVEQNEPSPVSPVDDEAFRLIESTIAELFPAAVPTPYVMMGATDSRFFTDLCERVYRYAPFRMTKAQRQSIHSYDEHLGVDALAEGVLWYSRLIERLPA